LVRHKYKNFLILLLLALFVTHASGQSLPNLTAEAYLVADNTGRIIVGTNVDETRSIASITKLMTAIVVLDSGQSLNEVIPKKLHNKNLTRQTLLELAIVKSDNEAAKMLCDYYKGGYNACIEAMNAKAQTLGMTNTKFVDPTGRYHENVSTAKDLVKLVLEASHYKLINYASNMISVKWEIAKKHVIEFTNTNTLVGKGYNFVVSKTGFIRKAGGCIVMMVDTSYGPRTVVLLGSKNMQTRIPEAYVLSQVPEYANGF
jgi:D-alanyl-D-alanine endopeptidase (penicillin-binding protein 7)